MCWKSCNNIKITRNEEKTVISYIGKWNIIKGKYLKNK